MAFVAEHAPVVRELSGTLYIRAKKPAPGGATRAGRSRTWRGHAELRGAVSVTVVPCHNEEMNIPRLVESILGF